MSLRPRPEIENLKACPHGGLNYAELRAVGLTPEAVLDFSVCTNPFPPSSRIRKVLHTAAIGQYPDSETTELRERLSERLAVPRDNIIAGSGTTELIRLIALAYFRPGDRVLLLEPTYGEYEIASLIVGAEPVKQKLRAEDNFAPGLAETLELIRRHHPRGVFIGNPNNPTGKYLSRREIETVRDALGDGLLVIDEAYVNFVPESWPSTGLISRGNVVILRSMTKDYALAGLRLGYAIARREIIRSLRQVCPPWNVNVMAQKIGAAVLGEADYLEQSKQKIGRAKEFLVGELSRLGCRVLPSEANFFLVRVGNAREFRTALLKHGIMVRDCASFGLPEYIRLAPRTLPECRKFITAIASVLSQIKQYNGSPDGQTYRYH